MNKFAKQLLPFCSLIFIISLWACLEPENFLSFQNFTNVLRRSSVNGIMAAGMTFIIIAAGIDLSVGSMLAMCGMLGSLSMLFAAGGTWQEISGGTFVDMGFLVMFLGTFAGIACGALCGFINGMLITRLKLAPFIVTLGSMSVFRGISYLINDGKPFAVSSYTYLDTGTFCGIPSAVWLLIIVLAGAGFLLNKTAFGRYTYAVGSNVQTAFHAGINVNKVLVMIYTLAGALVGLAAMITTSRASSAQPSAGMGLELDIIAAVIIGGTSPSGGRGSISGTVIGTLLISFLRNGLTLLDISTNVQLVVIGLIIIFAVTADQIAARREASC
ncbi:MAG: ABC transporter permease [Lentisphaeria bacterium]|nr:ABC transporter permease [Lentisphaeria bacterium]